MICVLEVINGPARGKRVWFRQNQCVEIGRVSNADFSISQDGHMSRRHLLLDSTGNEFRVRDIGSTNGTYLNDVKVLVQSLYTGDLIRAGSSTFLVTLRSDYENPHEADGVSFSKKPDPEEIVSRTEESLPQHPQRTIVGSNQNIDFDNSVESDAVESDAVELDATLKIGTNSNHSLLEASGTEAKDFASHFVQSWRPQVYFQSNAKSLNVSAFDDTAGQLVKDRYFGMVINQSVVQQEKPRALERLFRSYKSESISRTLALLEGSDTPAFWRLIGTLQGVDAMILLISSKPLSASKLAPYANSLSFPSMFELHLLDPNSDILDRMLQLDCAALFESKLHPHFVLLLPTELQKIAF